MEKKMAHWLKVLSDHNRLKIIKMLLEGEDCACRLMDSFPFSQPTLSYHLKVLNEANLTITKRDGNWMKHTVNKHVLDEIIQYFTDLKETKPTCSL